MWGQGGLSEHEMDRGEGLKWLTEPDYISNSTFLREVGGGGKTAQQAKHSGIHFSHVFPLSSRECFMCHIF